MVALQLVVSKGKQQSEELYKQWYVGGINTVGSSNKAPLLQIEHTHVYR